MRISDWSSDVCSSDLAAHFDARHFLGDALPAHQFPIGGPVLMEALVVLGIGDFDVFAQTQAQAVFFAAGQQNLRAHYQSWVSVFFVDDDLHSPQHALFFPLGKPSERSEQSREEKQSCSTDRAWW